MLKLRSSFRALSAIAAIGAIAAVLPAAAPVGAGGAAHGVPELTLPNALALLPDTPALRAAGVWYADYGLARRVYGVDGVDTMTDPRIARYFSSIVALRPGPETGVSSLVAGRWRQIYGYDLFELTSEIYSSGGGTPDRPIGVAVGQVDPAYIAHVLVTDGYTRTAIGPDRFFVKSAVPPSSMPGRAMNAIALDGGRLVAGAWPEDVVTATLRMQQRTGTLGRDSGYRALAEALGPVQGAYVAGNVPPSPYESSPFAPPLGGHRGPRLHRFGLYATAYQEPRPGQRYMEIALAYSLRGEAQADVATLRARLAREPLPGVGATWAQLTRVVDVSLRGRIVLARLRLRPGAPPTLWQDVVVEGALSILSP